MIEYLLATDEQRELAELAGKICEAELAPQIKVLETANGGLGAYPWDVHHKLADAGLYAMNVPKAYGGRDLGNVTRAMVMEEISKTDCGFAFSFRGLGDKFDTILNSHISEEEKRAWAERILRGDAGGAFALTEPEAGSDASALQSTAVKDGGEWVINGTKCMINNAGTASYFGVFAWTDKSVSAGKGVTCFLVESDRDGVKIPEPDDMMGLKLMNCGSIIFENVRVPEDHIVGELGRGFSTAMGKLDVARPFNAAFTCGAAQRAVDEAVKYANERKQFGKYIIEHQAVAFKLAELQMKVDAARAMLYYAMEAGDKGIPLGRIASGTKAEAIEMCVAVAFDAIQILGGYGVRKEYPLEKILRDLRAYTVMGGTGEIQRKIVAKTMMIKH
jgi:alkylation response protein AidB-like acyl-CoA dehydrogenase